VVVTIGCTFQWLLAAVLHWLSAALRGLITSACCVVSHTRLIGGGLLRAAAGLLLMFALEPVCIWRRPAWAGGQKQTAVMFALMHGASCCAWDAGYWLLWRTQHTCSAQHSALHTEWPTGWCFHMVWQTLGLLLGGLWEMVAQQDVCCCWSWLVRLPALHIAHLSTSCIVRAWGPTFHSLLLPHSLSPHCCWPGVLSKALCWCTWFVSMEGQQHPVVALRLVLQPAFPTFCHSCVWACALL
jgi:hypothetical protein